MRTGDQAAAADETSDEKTCIDINFVQMNIAGEEDKSFGFESKHFFYRKATSNITNSDVHGLPDSTLTTFVEITVANPFPCPLSRQKSLLISAFSSNR